MCDNCDELRQRVESLKQEVMQLEDRRSRERVRHLSKEHANDSLTMGNARSPDQVPPCSLCIRLLELIQQLVIDNPHAKGLDGIREELKMFKI